jgi:hypothetical protein
MGIKLNVPRDIENLLHTYAKQLSSEEKFEVSLQQAFERLVRIALGEQNGT